MRLAFLALALTLPATSSALPVSPKAASPPSQSLARGSTPSRFCRDDMKVRPIDSARAAGARRLGELPPGDLTLTVLNRVGDCIEPVTVRQGVGGFDGGPAR